MLKRLPSAIVSLSFTLALLIGLCLYERALGDPDTGWHIAAGDLILSLGHLPASDPWSYTAGSFPWLNNSWLADSGMSLAHRAGGLALVVKCTIALFALAAAMLCSNALRLGAGPISVMLAFIPGLLIILMAMLARPQMLTFLILAIWYAVLRFGAHRHFFILPFLMVLWVNVHGGFLIGFLTLGFFGAEALVHHRYGRVKVLTATFIACLLAMLVNPMGWQVLEGANRSLSSPLVAVLNEWRPLQFGKTDLFPALFAVIVIASGCLHLRSIPPADRLLAGVWLIYGLASIRMLIIATIFIFPVLAVALHHRLVAYDRTGAIRRKDDEYAADTTSPKGRKVGACFALITLALLFSPLPERALWPQPADFASGLAPKEEIAFIEANYPALRFLNSYNFGGYLIYARRGKIPVFIDGRATTAYPWQVAEDYIAFHRMGIPDPAQEKKNGAASSGIEWPRIVKHLREHYGVQGFFLPRNDPQRLLLQLDPAWKLVFEGKDAVIFVAAELAH